MGRGPPQAPRSSQTRPATPHSARTSDHAPGTGSGALRGLGPCASGMADARHRPSARTRRATPRICSPSRSPGCVDRPVRARSGCCSASPSRPRISAWRSAGTILGGPHRAPVGRRGAHLPPPPRDLLSISSRRRHFFGRRLIPHRAIDSRNLAWLAPLALRRGVAQQPPRLPHLRPRMACAAGRSTSRRLAHPRARAQLGLAWVRRPRSTPERQRAKTLETSE